MEILKLEHPIKINGEMIYELKHDPLEITAEQFLEACMRSSGKYDNDKGLNLRENNYSLHFYLGIMAITAVNPQYTVEDVKRVQGNDILAISDIGLVFTCRKWEDNSEENSSENVSEVIAATSEPLEPTQEECSLEIS